MEIEDVVDGLISTMVCFGLDKMASERWKMHILSASFRGLQQGTGGCEDGDYSYSEVQAMEVD